MAKHIKSLSDAVRTAKQVVTKQCGIAKVRKNGTPLNLVRVSQQKLRQPAVKSVT